MCTSFMGGFDHKIDDVRQRVAIAFTARSPIDRLVEAKRARGWTDLPVYSDESGDFTRTYVSADDDDMPAYNVFTSATARSGTSGARRSGSTWPTRDRTPAARSRWTRCGSSSTPSPTVAARIGTHAHVLTSDVLLQPGRSLPVVSTALARIDAGGSTPRIGTTAFSSCG